MVKFITIGAENQSVGPFLPENEGGAHRESLEIRLLVMARILLGASFLFHFLAPIFRLT